ncbi:general substrate transporter [Polychaeton citri CBS 116435]|uniref:General substrate transporter n=1 Tax=Polychaeton citri CBS 116435 TaxID=1314669 RepID=A0A9P4QC00_9PEZI|nr:general substrate transporter [Polychaeton citri CBS 116435]
MPPTLTAVFEKLRQPRYVTTCILCSAGGLLLGIDTSIIGPVTTMPSFTAEFGGLSPSIHGIVVSSILLTAAVSSFFAGQSADKLGRPRALALGTVVFLVGAVLQASAVALAMFAIGRVIAGAGYGLFIGTMGVYICEISPPRLRGPMTTGPQFATCLGLVVGYFTCYGTAELQGSLSWRLPYALLSTVAVAYLVTALILLPPSPRWLILRGRVDEAEKVWDRLGVSRSERALEDVDDASVPAAGLSVPSEMGTGAAIASTKPANFRDLWTKDVRRRTTLAIFLMGFLQLCGIDAVLYYAPVLFQQAGLKSTTASFLASGVSAILILITSIPATIYADKWGRRTCTLLGGIGLTISMLIIGSIYASAPPAGSPSAAAKWTIIITIYAYTILNATTWAISIKVWAPEIQPQHTRAQATALAYGSAWITNWFVAFVCPILLRKSQWGAYFLFGGCTAFATVVSFFYMVETRGKSLDEIERAFSNARTVGPGKKTLVEMKRVVGGVMGLSDIDKTG